LATNMADTMVIEGDDTADAAEGLRMTAETKELRGGKVVAAKRKGHSVLPSAEVKRDFIRGSPSDNEGLMQLFFHGAFVAAAIWMVSAGRAASNWWLIGVGEVFFGLVASFYFAGFHELIHNTAFQTRYLNKLFAHLFGFAVFRGAVWYWYFHWHHHRFTNDPERDPELSGTTVDRADPTKAPGLASKLWGYSLFLSGYPFGFERLVGMCMYAVGAPAPETWVDTPAKVRAVRQEYICFVLGYAALGYMAVTHPTTWGANLWWYWILPHILGAGHLRYYQTAEHRACKEGLFTDTNAWMVSRTTATWWVYCRLAWNMPYHQEHHAWPGVPFYKLPELHARVVKSPNKPKSGCTPDGDRGYMWMHWILFKQLLGSTPPVASKAA